METPQVATVSDNSAVSFKERSNGWLFPLVFIFLSVLSTLLVPYVPEYLHAFWLTFTISLARVIGSLTGIATASYADIISVNGFEMRIITQCTAIHYLLIISAAMLASYWHPLAYRLTGMMVAIPLLLVANAVRLLITGLAGAVSPQLFRFVHEYLWVTLFILLTWGIWLAWERGIKLGSLKRRLPVLILSCTLFHIILTLLSDTVGTLVTGLANMILAPFNQMEAVRFQWEGEKVLSVIGSETYTFLLTVSYWCSRSILVLQFQGFSVERKGPDIQSCRLLGAAVHAVCAGRGRQWYDHQCMGCRHGAAISLALAGNYDDHAHISMQGNGVAAIGAPELLQVSSLTS